MPQVRYILTVDLNFYMSTPSKCSSLITWLEICGHSQRDRKITTNKMEITDQRVLSNETLRWLITCLIEEALTRGCIVYQVHQTLYRILTCKIHKPGRIPFSAAFPPVVTFETFNGWLKSTPPAIENPHGAPPLSVTVKAAICFSFDAKSLWKWSKIVSTKKRWVKGGRVVFDSWSALKWINSYAANLALPG